MKMGLIKRHPMKKEAPENVNGLNKKTSDKKRSTPKNVNAAREQKAKPSSLTKQSKARVTPFGLITRSQTNVSVETKKQVTACPSKLPSVF
jgi:hypothetical protein